MTNTYFTAGTDKLDDMIASIDHGYLSKAFSPVWKTRNTGASSCMVGLGREIKDGKLTGKVVSPVTLTGYVPDLLKSISMVSDKKQPSAPACAEKVTKNGSKSAMAARI